LYGLRDKSKRMRRIERLRAWLFPLGALGFVIALLFSWASPRQALIASFGGAAALSLLLLLVSIKLAGGARQRRLSLRADECIQQADRHSKRSPQDAQLLQQKKELVQQSLSSKDTNHLEATLRALEDTLTRLGPSSMLRELVVLLVLSFGAALLLKTFFVEPFHIPSGSMYPTLHVGDHIFVNKFVYGLHLPGTKTRLFSGVNLPERGEVIVFHHDADTDYIKRVVAIPGDVVDVTMDEISINGFTLKREYEGELLWRELDPFTKKYEPRASNKFQEQNDGKSYAVIYDNPPNIMPSRHFVVPPGEYMVLGDNRDHSFDSLHWGFVPLEDIQGRAMFIVGSIEDSNFLWERLGIPIW
jgi:signal peptidase I